MITINQAPQANKILLDSNNTVISVTSTNGSGYYFRAIIAIDDVFFDEQGWSRKDNFTAEKDFKNFYKAYFSSLFNSTFVNGLQEQTNIKKKVSITIHEKNITNDVIVQTVILPDFYIMYNAKPVSFSDATKVQFLGVNADVFAIPSFGKISMPFMVNASAESISVTLKNDSNTILNNQMVSSFTGKKIYEYKFDLSGITISDQVLFLTLEITVGTTVISKIFRLFRYNYFNFPVKELVFKNVFGYYMYAYLDGQFSIDTNLEIKSYQQIDYTDKIYEINEEDTYTINSGSLVENEKEIINQIVTSLDAKMYYKNEWWDLKNATKKVSQFKDRNHSYSENLSFKVEKNKEISNFLFDSVVELPYISITNVIEISAGNFEFYFDYNFPLVQIFGEIIYNESTELFVLNSVLSPENMIIVSSGTNRRLKLSAVNLSTNQQIISNEYTF